MEKEMAQELHNSEMPKVLKKSLGRYVSALESALVFALVNMRLTECQSKEIRLTKDAMNNVISKRLVVEKIPQGGWSFSLRGPVEIEKAGFIYSGSRKDKLGGPLTVFVEEEAGKRLLKPGPSQELCNHSPDGFQWGFGGSGPAQLALAILLDCLGDKDVTLANYQAFKFEFVSKWGDDWAITERAIREWLLKKMSEKEK